MYRCIASSCGRTSAPSTDGMGRRTHPTGWTVLFVRVGADSSASKWLCADCSLKQYAAEGKVLLLLRERGL